MFLLGWVTARHSIMQWKARLRRISGSSFTSVLMLACVSGFALFFLTGAAEQHFAAVAHEVIGALLTVLLLEHWFIGRRRDAATRL